MAMTANFESLRQDLESMWENMNNLFETIDNDIIKTLNRYESSMKSINSNIISTIPEESTHKDSNPYDGNEAKHSELFSDKNDNNNDFDCLLHTVSMRRIVYILCEYNKYLNDPTHVIMHDFISNLNATYSITKLLNDFHFILYNDKLNDEFETIYNFLCDLIQKKGKIHSILNEYYFERDSYEKCASDIERESQEPVTLSVLNRIYFYFFHSFDMGYRLTENEKKEIQETIASINAVGNAFFDYKIPITTRYMTKKHKRYDRIDTKYMMNGLIKHQYLYWFEYINNAWFIYAKYSSLKDELLFHININSFSDLFCCALHYSKSMLCISMSRDDTMLSIQHIVSILLYLNFNIFRNEFLSTFYRGENESDLSLKSRHSHFGIFGRLFSECIQWFGDDCANTFYHILNVEKIIFTSFTTNVYIPLSATTNYNVILNKNILNNDEKGMVLKMVASCNTRYLDTRFLSKFVNEDETVFFGGDSALIFSDIIDDKIGAKYGIFLAGLDIIYTMMNGDWYKTKHIIDDILRGVVKDLLFKQLKQEYNMNTEIPQYIARILHCYSLNIKQITINWTSLNQEKHTKYKNWNGFLFLQNLFLCSDSFSDYKWIQLNTLCSLFPNVTNIKIITTRYHNLYLSEFIPNEVISFMSFNKKCNLNEISIKKPIQDEMSIQEAISTYNNRFQQNINWNIKQIADKWNDKYLIFHKM